MYNDATFSEADFASISSIGRSRKREDTAAIGRYGLGFNVSYHFADVVEFVSGDSVVVFDPHGQALPAKEMGLRARFTDGFGARYPGLMQPLLGPLHNIRGGKAPDTARPVDSTLFRLPLRTAAQAATSQLSARAVAPAEVRQLLLALCESAGELLLFTQHLTSIEACVLGADGELVRLGGASIDAAPGASPDSRAALAALSRRAAPDEAAADMPPTTAAPLTFELQLSVTRAPGAAPCAERWLLCGGAHCDEESELLAAALGQPAAWSSLALPLHEGFAGGRAFCFLPLPLSTGLPVHVNGCFALTSSRREIWTEDADPTLGGGARPQHERKARWNRLLCHEALPRLYAHALDCAAQRALEAPPPLRAALLRLWPTGGEAAGGLWRGLQRATLRTLHASGRAVCACAAVGAVALGDPARQLMPLRDVALATEALADGADASALRAGLAECGVRLWAAPAGAERALREAGLEVPRASAAAVCAWLVAGCATGGSGSVPAWWGRPLVRELLEHVLGGREGGEEGGKDDEGEGDEDRGEGEGDEDHGEEGDASDSEGGDEADDSDGMRAAPLDGLSVLPLAGGGLGLLRRVGRRERARRVRGAAERGAVFYVGGREAEQLLPRCGALIESGALAELGFCRLRRLVQECTAAGSGWNLQPLDARALLGQQCMRALLPASWQHRPEVDLGEARRLGNLDAAERAAAPEPSEPVSAAKGWTPKGRKGKGKQRAAEGKGRAAFLKDGGAAAEGTPAAAEEPAPDKEGLRRRLTLLWRLVDEAACGPGGEWGTAEASLLDEWPCVLSSRGTVLTVARAKTRAVLQLDSTFAAGGALAPPVLGRFGVLFLDPGLRSRYLAARVCGGADRLGAALQAGCAIGSADSSLTDAAGRDLSHDDCLALRSLLLRLCLPSEGGEEGEGEEEGEEGVEGSTIRAEAPPAVVLPASALRRLPVFETLGGRACVTLQHIGARVMGTPAEHAWVPRSRWDEDLRGVLGDSLLSYETEEERALLRLANAPRGTPAELAAHLSAQLSRHELPQPALLHLLAAAGSPKQMRLSSGERDELVRRLSGFAVVVMPDGKRCKASEFVDPSDSLLCRALGVGGDEAGDEGGDDVGGDEGGDEGGAIGGAGAAPARSALASLGAFPPLAYLSSPQAMAGLRACGMASLDEPDTFVRACEAVAAAAEETPAGLNSLKSPVAAVGLALFELMLARWAKLALHSRHIAQLVCIKFVPCSDKRLCMLPGATPPSRRREPGKAKGGKAKGEKPQLWLDESEPGAASPAKPYEEAVALKWEGAARCSSWWEEHRSRLGSLRGQAWPQPQLVFASLRSGVALSADAWLAWAVRPLLPPCADAAPRHVLDALGLGAYGRCTPVPADVCCEHLAVVSRRWKAAPAEATALLGPPLRQGFSLLCCAHAAAQLWSGTAERDWVGGQGHMQGGARSGARAALRTAPFIVTDDGSLVPGRVICTELFSDLGPHARALPGYLRGLGDFLVDVGGAMSSAQLDVPGVAVSAPNPHDALFARLCAQCDDPAHSDVVFTFGEGEAAEEVHAHKLLLSLTSATFAAMFTSAMEEGCHARRAHIALGEAGFSASTFRRALHYVYHGALPDGDHALALRPDDEGLAVLLELLRLCDYLGLEHLRQTCERLAVDWEVIQVENVCALLEHAAETNAEQLAASCVCFIREMHEVVAQTEAYARLSPERREQIARVKRCARAPR